MQYSYRRNISRKGSGNKWLDDVNLSDLSVKYRLDKQNKIDEIKCSRVEVHNIDVDDSALETVKLDGQNLDQK